MSKPVTALVTIALMPGTGTLCAEDMAQEGMGMAKEGTDMAKEGMGDMANRATV